MVPFDIVTSRFNVISAVATVAALLLVSTENLDLWPGLWSGGWPGPIFLSMRRKFISYSANQIWQSDEKSVNRQLPEVAIPEVAILGAD